ncbi:MAG: DNA mismatch repair endonuclease MutL [Treponema sp.]|jgi:DNA mismatch repair protein MutL|nr:DNA mismatch repair endonuclease MutL [Treponema sp.]
MNDQRVQEKKFQEEESAAPVSRISILPPEEARKIAAGEVIDRPAALVREFVDNAIDAGSSLVEVFIDGGGIRRVEVADDGNGMGKEDLKLCWYTHATSKIRSLEDLNTAETLGFRGEALAAAAAVSRLEILSSVDGREAWRLETGPGGTEEPQLTQISRVKGTSVRSLGLFDTIPVRKRFLKRESAEAGFCRQIFLDKALAFPALTFRFVQDGQLKIFLPSASSFKDRYAQALMSRNEGPFLHEITAQGPGFSVVIVAGGPELYRSDRRQQYVFANGRRIQDFSLLQALEYGLQGWFPNTAHPVGAIYLDIDPSLADFNIHPAKREARFREAGVIHHAITTALSSFSHHRNIAASAQNRRLDEDLPFAPDARDNLEDIPLSYQSYPPRGSGPLAMEALLDKPPAFAPLPGRGWDRETSVHERAPVYDPDISLEGKKDRSPAGIRIAGRLFNLFILVEWKDRLFIIDHHAAHERAIYDRLVDGSFPKQELLVPIPFFTESDEDDEFLILRREDLARLGVVITREERGWYIEALPSGWKLSDTETVRSILDLRTAGENMVEHWAATLSCHGAIKDGDYLDDTAALTLAKKVLELHNPRCPHGRPIWFEMSREDLFRAVRRS